MTTAELLEAGMTTVANRIPGSLPGSKVGSLESAWYWEHAALMDYNAESRTRATYNSLVHTRGAVIRLEKELRR